MILSNKQKPPSRDVQLSWILTLNVVSHYGSWVWGTSKMYVLNLPSYLGIKIQCSYLGYLKCEAVNAELYADDSLSAIYYSLTIKKIGGKKDFLGGASNFIYSSHGLKRKKHAHHHHHEGERITPHAEALPGHQKANVVSHSLYLLTSGQSRCFWASLTDTISFGPDSSR